MFINSIQFCGYIIIVKFSLLTVAQDNSYSTLITPLNCSQFGVKGTGVSPQLINWEARLHACFSNYSYDTTQLPVPTAALPLEIYYDWALYNLLSFQDGVISLNYQLAVIWTDYLRSWDPMEVPIAIIQVPINEIWYPQFYIGESGDKKYLLSENPVEVAFLGANGLAYYTAANIVKGKCSLNLWNFPFDTQTCKLTYILKRFFNPMKKMDVLLKRSSMAYRFDLVSDDEWEIVSTQNNATNITGKEYKYRTDGSTEDTPSIIAPGVATGFEVYIKLRRYSSYYVVNIITPLLSLAVLDNLPFAMEDVESEKLVTAVSVVLGYMFLQGIVATLLPKSNITPYLAGYIAASIALSAASAIADGFCYSLCFRNGEPGKFVEYVILKGLGTILFPSKLLELCWRLWKAKRSRKKVGSLSGKTNCSELFTGNFKKEELNWREVASVLNRLFALLHLFGSLIFLVVLFMPILFS